MHDVGHAQRLQQLSPVLCAEGDLRSHCLLLSAQESHNIEVHTGTCDAPSCQGLS